MPGVSIGIGYNLFGNDRLSGPIGAANARMRAFTSSIDANAQQMQVATMMGAGLVTMIGVKLTGALKRAIGTAASMEDIMLGVQRVGGFTNDQIEKMEKNFLQLSAALPLSAEELARVGVIAGRLGVKGVESIQKLAFTSAQLARATVLTEETAASALARISRLFKLDVVTSANAVSSALVGMATSSTATAEEIADITVRMGGMASVMGITAHQSMALAATMRDAGLRVEMGGSAVMRILSAMTSKQAAFAKIIGVTTEQYRMMFKQDPMGAFVRLLHAVKGIDKMDLSKILKGIGLSNVRTSMTVLGLSRQLGTLQRNLGNAANMYREGAKVGEMYELMTRSLTAKMDTLTGSIKNIFILTGKFLLPIFKAVVQVGIEIASVFLYLPTPIHAVVAGLFLLAGVIGILLAQAMALKLMTFMLTGSMGAMAGTTGVLSASLGMYRAALSSAIGSVKSMVVEMWAGILAMKKWIVQNVLAKFSAFSATVAFEGLGKATSGMRKKLASYLVTGRATILLLWGKAKAAAAATYGFIKMRIEAVWAFAEIYSEALAAATGIAFFNSTLGKATFLVGLVAAAMLAVALVTKVIIPLFSKLYKFLADTLSGGFKILGAVIGLVTELIIALWQGLKIGVATILSPLIAAVYVLGVALNIVSAVLTPLIKLVTWLLNILRPLIAPILAIASALGIVAAATWLYFNASLAWTRLAGFMSSLMTKLNLQKVTELYLKMRGIALYWKEVAVMYWQLNLRKAGLRAKLKEWYLDIKTYVLAKKKLITDKLRLAWGKRELVLTKLRTAAKWAEIAAEKVLGKARYAGMKNWVKTNKLTKAGQSAMGKLSGSLGMAGASAGAVAGVVLAVVAAVVLAIVMVYKWIQAFRKASNAGKAFMAALLLIGSFLLGPIAAGIAPLLIFATAVYVALTLIVNAIRLIAKWVKKLWNSDLLGVKTLWNDIGDAISAIFAPIGEFIDGIGEVTSEASIMEAVLTPVFKVIKWGLEGIMFVVKVLGAFLGPIISAVIWSFKALWGIVKEVWGIFSGLFSDIFSVAKEAVMPFIDIIGELLSVFGIGGGKDGLTGSVMSVSSVIGSFIGGALKGLIVGIKVLVFILKVLLFPIKIFLKSLAFMLKIGGTVLKFFIMPMIKAFKWWISVLGTIINILIWPFKMLWKVIMLVKNALFGSSFLHIWEGIKVVMKPIMWIVNAFLKLFGIFKAAKEVVSKVWGALKSAVGVVTAPIKAVGQAASWTWDKMKQGAGAAISTAKKVGGAIVGAVGGGLKAVGKGAKKAWNAIFGSGFLHIPEGIMATFSYFRLLGSWFDVLDKKATKFRMEAPLAGFGGMMTVKHELHRGPLPVRLVTLTPAPYSMPPPAREIIEIRARIPVIIELDGARIGEAMGECSEFEVIRNYREPCRTFTGICK